MFKKKLSKIALLAASAAFILVGLPACSGDDDDGDGDEFKADTVLVTAAELGASATSAESSDASVVTAEVSDGGVKLTSKKEGSATVTAHAKDYTDATISVTVSKTGKITKTVTKFVQKTPNSPFEGITVTVVCTDGSVELTEEQLEKVLYLLDSGDETFAAEIEGYYKDADFNDEYETDDDGLPVLGDDDTSLYVKVSVTKEDFLAALENVEVPEETYFTEFVAETVSDANVDTAKSFEAEDGTWSVTSAKYQKTDSNGNPVALETYDYAAGTGYSYSGRIKVQKNGVFTIKTKASTVLRIDGGNANTDVRKMSIIGANKTEWEASAQGSFYLTATAETVVLESMTNEFCIYGIHVVDEEVASTSTSTTTYEKPVVELSADSVAKDDSEGVTVNVTIPQSTTKTIYSTGKVETTKADVTAEITYAGATVTDGKVDISSVEAGDSLTITASYTADGKTYTSEPVTLKVTAGFESKTATVANNEVTLGLVATGTADTSDETVATAVIDSSNITITSHKKGTATITVTSADGKSATIDVTVDADGSITTTVHMYVEATEDSWNFVLTEKDTDGNYLYGSVVFKNTTNLPAKTVLPGASGNLNITVTGDKVQVNSAKANNNVLYGVMVKNTPLTISSIKGKVTLTVVWGTESKTDRSLSVKVGSADAVETSATGKNIKNETETYAVSFDAGDGTDVVIGATNDSFIKTITVSAQ